MLSFSFRHTCISSDCSCDFSRNPLTEKIRST